MAGKKGVSHGIKVIALTSRLTSYNLSVQQTVTLLPTYTNNYYMIFIVPTSVTCVAKSRVAPKNYQTRGDRKNVH